MKIHLWPQLLLAASMGLGLGRLGAADAVPVFTNQIKSLDVLPKVAGRTNEAADRLVLASPLQEVVKLSKAGVEEPVVIAFVQASRYPYRPSAQEVLKLRELGVSPAVITALLRRAAEAPPEKPPEPAPSPVTPPAAPPAQPPAASVGPAPVYVPSPVYVSDPYQVPFSWGVYGYGYPGYGGFGWWPHIGFRAGFAPGIGIGLSLGGSFALGHHHH